MFALTYNLGNCLRHLALPKTAKEWLLRTLREKLIKIGAKVVRNARYVISQMAELLVSRSLFHEILERIGQLKPISISIS
ncbi:MAG: transposase [candidate division Zixibacteria bacterium]|nr:transposase [candidate division Zixibacteria bacterium]